MTRSLTFRLDSDLDEAGNLFLEQVLPQIKNCLPPQ